MRDARASDSDAEACALPSSSRAFFSCSSSSPIWASSWVARFVTDWNSEWSAMPCFSTAFRAAVASATLDSSSRTGAFLGSLRRVGGLDLPG